MLDVETAWVFWLQALILYTIVVNTCTAHFAILYFGIFLTEYIYGFHFMIRINAISSENTAPTDPNRDAMFSVRQQPKF